MRIPPSAAKSLISLISMMCAESGQFLAQRGAASVSGRSASGYAQSYPQIKWKKSKALQNHRLKRTL
jgi:hypothetical protein